ncbi:hypothetical protein [Gracilibacillus sp. JCM 18860]|uniref:hypothetical protein n=1 Tax=Gracilibacillus sp. JCM 18860 TaxID=1306159 RepID=UPI000A4CA4CB
MGFLIFVTDFKIIQTIITNKLIICLGMYLFYTFIVSLITEGLITSIGYSLGQLSLFIGIIMFLYYRQKYSFETFKKLVYVLLAIWIYYCWKAIIFYNKNEFAARDIISHQGEQYGNVAIGEGYGLAFGSALLGVSISYLLFQSISKPKKL